MPILFDRPRQEGLNVETIFQRQLWDEVQDRIEASIHLELLTKNIKPTNELVEDELDKRMIILVEKLCDLAFS